MKRILLTAALAIMPFIASAQQTNPVAVEIITPEMIQKLAKDGMSLKGLSSVMDFYAKQLEVQALIDKHNASTAHVAELEQRIAKLENTLLVSVGIYSEASGNASERRALLDAMVTEAQRAQTWHDATKGNAK